MEVVPLLDAHVHLWDHSVAGLEWTWMKPGAGRPGGRGAQEVDAPRYTPVEFRAESAGASVLGMVGVHSATLACDPPRETAWLQALADEDGWPQAAVGFCQLGSPGAAAVLRAHGLHPVVRGVRDLTVSQELDLEAAAPAMAVAAELGLSVEMRTPLDRFPVMRALAEQWPSVSIVLSHAGLPAGRTPDDLGPWAAAMAGLSGAPNVTCKVSALASASDPDWTVDSLRPWLIGCLEAFGPDRCMLATNWPFDRPWGRYPDVVAAYREIASVLTIDEQHALFHGTAEQIYRIAPMQAPELEGSHG
ncbi:MAG: amidohydrolase family protein [Acidobacteria bacterium]|nr:amidohydrolase family protein [Acidobacteriota bacterium]